MISEKLANTIGLEILVITAIFCAAFIAVWGILSFSKKFRKTSDTTGRRT